MDDLKREFLQAIRDGNESKVKEILAHGLIDVNKAVSHNEPTQTTNPHPIRMKTWNGGRGNNYHDVQDECAGYSALHQAAADGQAAICKVLIRDFKAKVNIINPDCDSPIHLAAAAGNIEACTVLIKDGRANVNLQNKIGSTPLHVAVDGNHTEVCKLLIKDGKAKVNLQNKWGTALHRAAGNNQTDMCRILLEDGNANVNLQNKFGDTPLHRAAYEKQVESCRILIEEGDAKVNICNKGGETPLHTAVTQNSTDICEILLKIGKAKVNIKSKADNTPLHHAMRRNHAQVAKLLLELGDAHVDIKNRDGKTALQYKFEKRENREMIIDVLKNVTQHKELQKRGQPVKTVKLFIVGNHDAGKTTLINSLSKGKGFLPSWLTSSSGSTADTYCPVRVELKKISGAGRFVVWDMAGQVEFHITHAMFLGKSKGIFIIAYDGSASVESMTELMYWLRFLKAGHNPLEPKPKVIIVLTHLDKIKNVDLVSKMAQSDLDKLVKDYGAYVDIHPEAVLLDARKKSGRVLDSLKQTLNKMAEPWRADHLPNICDEISKAMTSWCLPDLPLLKWPEFVEKVKTIDSLADEETVTRAVQYLHDTGMLFHAKIAGKDDIIILDVNWLASKIFCPVFAKHDLKLAHPGLRNQQKYTRKDLEDQIINVSDPELLINLLQHFELAYCYNRDGEENFIIPAKLPQGIAQIDWQPDPSAYFRYTGLRIECQDMTDMFSVDTVPCIQVQMMNEYCQAGDTPMLSNQALKVFDQAEGMVQQTTDKRAIHIAVREKVGVHQDAAKQLLEMMKAIMLDVLKERSVGTRICVSYLSSAALMTSNNLVDNIPFHSENQVDSAEKSKTLLVSQKSLVAETVSSVKGCLDTSQNWSHRSLSSISPLRSANQPPHQTYRNAHSLPLTDYPQDVPVYYHCSIPQLRSMLQNSSDANGSHEESGQPKSLVAYPTGAQQSYNSDHQQASYYCSSSLLHTSGHMVPHLHGMTATPSLQNLLEDSFYDLPRNQNHSSQINCRPQCPWNCMPVQQRKAVYESIDCLLHCDTHCRNYRPMAEAFGIPDNEFAKIDKYHSRDLSLSATIIKVAFLKRSYGKQEPLSIQEVLTVTKHPGIVGNEPGAKVIEEFLAENDHHGPYEYYELNFGVSNEVLLHRAVLKQTQHYIRRNIKASNIATSLVNHISDDDRNQILSCEDEKVCNYPQAVDLLIVMLMKLKHVDWFQPFLDAMLHYATLSAHVLMEERTKLLRHSAFSPVAIASKMEGTTDEDLDEDTESPTVMAELFRRHAPIIMAPKSRYENPAYETDSSDQEQ